MAIQATEYEVKSRFLRGFLELYAVESLIEKEFISSVFSSYRIYARLELPNELEFSLEENEYGQIQLEITFTGKKYSTVIQYEGYPLMSHELLLLSYRDLAKAIAVLEEENYFTL